MSDEDQDIASEVARLTGHFRELHDYDALSEGDMWRSVHGLTEMRDCIDRMKQISWFRVPERHHGMYLSDARRDLGLGEFQLVAIRPGKKHNLVNLKTNEG